MPLFDYTALDREGRRKKGVLEAETDRDARAKLRAKGLFPLGLEAESRSGRGRGLGLGKVPAKELAQVMRQLTFLVGAGLPVVEALAAVVDQSGHGRLGRVMGRVKDEVVSGRSLAEAMAAQERVFPQVAINMIKAGEAAGALEIVLERLADLMESRVRLGGRIRGALAYPILIILISGGVLTFMFTYVIPTVTGIFAQTGRTLPLATRILMGLSDFLIRYGWLIGVLLAGLLLLLLGLRRSSSGRRGLDRFKLRLPLFGTLVRRITLTRITKTLATLLSSGVGLVESLEITSKVAGNRIYQENLEAARKTIEQGGGLAGCLAETDLYPPVVAHLAAAGEKSAQLDKVFDRLAVGFEEEVESSLSTLLSLLEPVLILIMGLVVGFIVISILLPIFDMTNMVG